ncbi:MAG: FlgO family outer membrane protein [Colwellia sp.]
MFTNLPSKSVSRASQYGVLVLLLGACSSVSHEPIEHKNHYQHYVNRSQFIQNYVDAMADSLIVNDHYDRIKRGRVAIGTIGMIDTLKLSEDNTHPLNLLGLKLQDGLITSFLNRGYKVVEYRRAKNIIIRDNQDLMLTREIEYLQQDQNLSYFLTGTIAYQENGASVSLRIIDIENDQVSAATTKFIPIDVFWDRRQVTSYDGMIYRNSHSGGE